MSLTLGEKLQQAREARGLTIRDVAEQTRISPLYIESIEKDDYQPLPGGIFNKGFVKSFARSVGVDEQEALQDYAKLAADESNKINDDPKTYRPEVLTTDRSSTSNIPTIIFAVIILGLMTWGVLALVNYVQNTPSEPAANIASNSAANTDVAGNVAMPNTNTVAASSAPSLDNLKIDFNAVDGDIYVSSVNDGKPSNTLLKKGNSVSFETKEKLQLTFARERVQFAQMQLNDKQIKLPSPPAKGKIVLEIDKNNAREILDSGEISLAGTTAPR